MVIIVHGLLPRHRRTYIWYCLCIDSFIFNLIFIIADMTTSIDLRWDLLVLTAGDESQKRSFQLHMSSIDLSSFIVDYRIYTDQPVGAKIGMFNT